MASKLLFIESKDHLNDFVLIEQQKLLILDQQADRVREKSIFYFFISFGLMNDVSSKICLFFSILVLAPKPKIVNKIKQVLDQQNKTEAWLAKRLGCPVETVHNWCANHEEPSLNQLFKIMRALGVQADDVWKANE